MKLLELFDILHNTINEDVDEVTFWTKYAGHRDFPDESSARDFIARKANLGYAWTMGIDDPVEHYARLAKEMPVYQTKKGWRIGTPQVFKRLQGQRNRMNRFAWSSVDLLDVDWVGLFSSGLVNRFDVDHIDGPKLVSMRKINGTETTNREHSEKIAQQIKEMYKFRPIVLDDNFTIVDGHHRFEAAQLMKMKDIPAYIVYTQESVNEARTRLVSSEDAAAMIANDDELFDAVASYTTYPDVFDDYPEQLQKFLGILKMVRPFKKRLYRGELSYEYNNFQPYADHIDRGFTSWTAAEDVAKKWFNEKGNMVKYTDGPVRAVSIADLVTARMRLRQGESHYSGMQAEYLVLEPVKRKVPREYL